MPDDARRRGAQGRAAVAIHVVDSDDAVRAGSEAAHHLGDLPETGRAHKLVGDVGELVHVGATSPGAGDNRLKKF